MVTEDVPEYSLVAGVPARVIRGTNYPRSLTLEEKDKLAKEVLKDFHKYMEEYIGNKEVVWEETHQGAVIIKSNIGNIVYSKELDERLVQDPKLGALKNFCLVSFVIRNAIRKKHDWIELESESSSSDLNGLALELAAFVRRYGVRLVTNQVRNICDT